MGTFGQNFNYEAIQEVNVSTTGISAEYGRSQGAYVNVITKSGTNQFHDRRSDLDQRRSGIPRTRAAIPTGGSFARIKYDKVIKDYAYTLGGPFWQDHVWFFGAYEHGNRASAQTQTSTSSILNMPSNTGQNYTQATNTRLWDGKLSAQVTPSQLFVCAVQQRPHHRLRR